MIQTSQNEQKKSWTNNLKDILDQEKKSIEANKSEHSTKNFPWPLTNLQGEGIHIPSLDTANIHFANTTGGNVSWSMNADLINSNKQVNNQRFNDDN